MTGMEWGRQGLMLQAMKSFGLFDAFIEPA
ncbi:hypothetical protein U771_17745 [Pseudomonas gorinensis]|jgi:hypothetical protein|uniref:Uncharacterized protein n=1 Tax=Pseudomonas gorinensis TaxID=3240790 RepID=A0ACA7P7Y1_9PSED|nr:hypothetical protein U771_17745 [Pseudomonas sp. TKP]